MGQLTVVKNPFAPWDGRLVKKIEAGVTLGEVLEEYKSSEFRVSFSVNGKINPDLDYEIVDGDIVTVMAQVGDKDSLRLVASVVLVAVVSYFTFGAGTGYTLGALSGGALGAGATGLGAFATYAIGGALTAGGMMLLNEILPPSTPNVQVAGDSLTDANTYGWGQQRNQVNEGFTVPVLYGTHRISPQIISQRRSFVDNKDRLNVLFLLTEGRSDASTPTVYLNDRVHTEYTGASVSYRRGDITQTNIGDGFDDIVTQKAVGTVLDPNTSDTITVTTDGTAVEKLTVGITLPGGLYAYSGGGYGFLDLGVYIEYRAVGDVTWIPFDGMGDTVDYTTTETQQVQVGTRQLLGVRGENEGEAPVYESQQVEVTRTHPMDETGFWFYNNSPDTIRAQFSHGASALTPDQYEVRIRKIKHYETLNGNTTFYNNVRVDFIEESIEEPLTYPGRTLLSLTSVAQEEIYGSAPVVQVVANRGELLLYDGVWGSSTVVTGRASSNPAWACYDLLTNPLYGGNIHPDNIILADFQAWADYCDLEGLECHIYLETGMTMMEALRKVSILGWGSVIQRGTDYGAIYDGPQDETYFFGMGNILAGTFNMSYLERASRARTVELTYWDSTLDYDRRIVTRRLDDTSGETDFRKASVSLPGCTSRTQADKHCQLALRKNQYITRTVTFQAEIDSIHCQVGDVVGVSHDIPRYGISGRVVSGTTTTVTLDHEITLTNDTYYITLKYADDTSETVEISESNGDFTTVSISSGSFSSTPAKDDWFSVGLVDSTVRKFRITSIRKSQEFQAEVTGIEYRPEIYNFDAPVPDYPTNKLIASVSNLQLSEGFQKFNDGSIRGVLNIAWDGFSTEWNVKVWKVGSGAVSPQWNDDVSERRFTVSSLQPDLKQTFRVRVTGLDGTFVEDTTDFLIEVPPAPINLRSKVVDKFLFLNWEQPESDLPIDYWEVYQGKDYLDAKKIGNTKTDSFASYIEGGGFNVFHVVAVDMAGQRSDHTFLAVNMESEDDDYEFAVDPLEVDGTGSGSEFFWDGEELYLPFTDPGDDWDGVWQSAYPTDYTTKTWDEWVPDRGVRTYMDAVTQVSGTTWGTTGNYTQTWDLGAKYPTRMRIEVILNDKPLVGPRSSTTLTHTIEYSEDGVTYFDYDDEIVAEHGLFRYVRLTLNAVGNGQSAVAVAPEIRLNARTRKELGSGTISNASSGLTVNFTFEFFDVRKITVTPKSASARIGAFDFTDVPFPTSFIAYLYDTDNNKVTGDFSYEIEGI